MERQRDGALGEERSGDGERLGCLEAKKTGPQNCRANEDCDGNGSGNCCDGRHWSVVGDSLIRGEGLELSFKDKERRHCPVPCYQEQNAR